MAKPVTEKEKQELLSLKQEELSVPILTKLFSKHSSKKDGKFVIIPPKFNTQSFLHLKAGEYINKKDVDTTVGSFLFNKLMVEGMIEEVVPDGYYNAVINKGGFGKLLDMISEGLMEGTLPVEPNLIKWLKHYEFYGLKLCTLFSPSYTEGMLKQNISVVKEKEKLLKTKKIETSTDMTDIEDELVARSHKILEKDPGITLFDSGARGAFDKLLNCQIKIIRIIENLNTLLYYGNL